MRSVARLLTAGQLDAGLRDPPTSFSAGIVVTHFSTRQTDIPTSNSTIWVNRYQLDRGERDDGLTTAEREELERLRRENARLKQEHEILRKAAAFLARDEIR